MATGLNYGVIQRLKTISATPVSATPVSATPVSATPVSATHQPRFPDSTRELLLTTGGDTYDLHFSKESAPFAGCHPRVEALNALCEDIILGEIKDESDHGWGLEIHKRFDVAVMNEDVVPEICNKDLFTSELLSAFSVAYDASPPENAEQFRELVMPMKFAPDNYISVAASKLTYKNLYDGMLLKLNYKHAIVKLPYSVSSRELKISQMIHANDVAKTLWKRIKRNYKFYDHDAFSAPAEKKKIMLLSAFTRVADAAITENELVCAPSTLKNFAISAY
jgi:hypothetical protein